MPTTVIFNNGALGYVGVIAPLFENSKHDMGVLESIEPLPRFLVQGGGLDMFENLELNYQFFNCWRDLTPDVGVVADNGVLTFKDEKPLVPLMQITSQKAPEHTAFIYLHAWVVVYDVARQMWRYTRAD